MSLCSNDDLSAKDLCCGNFVDKRSVGDPPVVNPPVVEPEPLDYAGDPFCGYHKEWVWVRDTGKTF